MRRVLLIFLLLSCSQNSVSFDSGDSFFVEIANTPDEHAHGLMYRESLPSGRGMLFVFDEEQPRAFWMKNTYIPLDMVFIASNGTVVEVKRDVPACKEESCVSYRSLPARYVLEVNAGEAKNIGEGSIFLGK
ncbi:DUF192 domain-containing protein [Candidatus Woesearchaeota archaeon]|nr:DUF192 domain-containing protein [Candidatus Woesearchaeota archaeon]